MKKNGVTGIFLESILTSTKKTHRQKYLKLKELQSRIYRHELRANDHVKKSIDRFVYSYEVRSNLYNTENYTAHHLFPKCYFPHEKNNIELGVPLYKNLHEEFHEKYNKFELLLDPITPLIELVNSKV
jgi:hypothetical protein